MSEKESENNIEIHKKKARSLAGKAVYLSGLFILLLVVLFAAGLLVPQLFGIHEYAVVSGSMEPAIHVGSLACVSSTDPAALQPGDIIAYRSRSRESVIVIHRVMENDTEEELLITKGDANPAEDILPVEYSQVEGKVTFCIPAAGRLFMIFGQ